MFIAYKAILAKTEWKGGSGFVACCDPCRLVFDTSKSMMAANFGQKVVISMKSAYMPVSILPKMKSFKVLCVFIANYDVNNEKSEIHGLPGVQLTFSTEMISGNILSKNVCVLNGYLTTICLAVVQSKKNMFEII